MSLVQKPITPEMAKANRENSLKSTGPKTALGTARSSLNACKHGAFARVSPPYLKGLGEDPGKFEMLRESMHSSFSPEDDFEVLLIDDMAEIRWRLMRLRRAEAANLARRRWESVSEPAKARLVRHGSSEEATAFFQSSFISRPDSSLKFKTIVDTLVEFREAIQTKGFEQDMGGRLKSVYGDKPCWIGQKLMEACQSLRNSQEPMEPAIFDRAREALLKDIDIEIAHFRKLLEVYLEGETAIAECRRDALLLPYPDDITRTVRYETMLERQFKDKLRQLMDYRSMIQRTPRKRDIRPGGEVQTPSAEASGVADDQGSESITSE